MSERLKKYSYFFLIFLIIISGFLFRLKLLTDNPSFWFDESALGYNVLNLNYKDFFGILHLQQVAPPLFLIISKYIADIIGASDLHLRLVPFIFGNLCMILFFIILKQNFENRLTVLSGLILFCFNAQLIKYCVEFKPYVVETFATCIILYLLSKFDWNWSYKKLFLIGTFLSILPWFAFISTVMLTLFYMVIFSIKNIKKWILFFMPSLISFIAIAFYYLNINKFYAQFMDYFFKDMFFYYHDFPIFLLMNIGFLFNVKFAILPVLLLVCSVMYYLLSKKYNYVLNFSILIILCSILLSFLHKYPFYHRFILYLYPVLIFIILFLINRIFSLKKYYLTIIALMFLILISFSSFGYMKSFVTKKFDKHDCARELFIDLSSKIKHDDIIIVDTLSTPDFLYYNSYFRLNNKLKFNMRIDNGIIMYKYDKNVKLPIEKNKNYWFYSPWISGKYGYLKYEYINSCKFGGKLMYLEGNKQ